MRIFIPASAPVPSCRTVTWEEVEQALLHPFKEATFNDVAMSVEAQADLERRYCLWGIGSDEDGEPHRQPMGGDRDCEDAPRRRTPGDRQFRGRQREKYAHAA